MHIVINMTWSWRRSAWECLGSVSLFCFFALFWKWLSGDTNTVYLWVFRHLQLGISKG